MKLVIHKNAKAYKFNGLVYKELTPSTSKNNYPKINFYKGGGQKPITRLIHRLLATGYIPNPENKPCVNHKNGIKIDNNLSNLEWVTHRENTIHSFQTGLQKTGNRGGCISAYKTRQGKLSWRCEIMHKGKYFKKKNMNKQILETWLQDLLKELN